MQLAQLWEQWASQVSQSPQVSPHDQGFAEGLAAASSELRILLAQLGGLPLPSPYELANGDIEMDFRPAPDQIPEESESEWEYLYVTFEQTPQGDWLLKDMHGLWQPDWGNTPSFEQAIALLRERQGWRLTNFAKGIHVFRRARNRRMG
jgi:hypothetical protein